jgi:hypothetical protein
VKRILPLVFLVLILAAAGVGYWKRDVVVDFYHRHINTERPASTAGPLPWPGSTSPDSSYTPSPYPGRPPEVAATPLVSRLPPPSPDGAKQHTAPGTFYVTKRKKLENRIGVQAVMPGELVRLIERLPDGRLRVTIDNIDFVMLPSEVTSDLDVAREAEQRYFETLRAQR